MKLPIVKTTNHYFRSVFVSDCVNINFCRVSIEDSRVLHAYVTHWYYNSWNGSFPSYWFNILGLTNATMFLSACVILYKCPQWQNRSLTSRMAARVDNYCLRPLFTIETISSNQDCSSLFRLEVVHCQKCRTFDFSQKCYRHSPLDHIPQSPGFCCHLFANFIFDLGMTLRWPWNKILRFPHESYGFCIGFWLCSSKVSYWWKNQVNRSNIKHFTAIHIFSWNDLRYFTMKSIENRGFFTFEDKIYWLRSDFTKAVVVVGQYTSTLTF